MPWYGYALIAFFFSPWYSISQKWALNLKIHRTKLLTYTFIGLFLCYLGYNLLTDYHALLSAMSSKEFILWGLLVAALSLVGNILQIKAFKEAPNPGYVQAVIASNILVVLILSAVIFDSPITSQKLIGVLIVLFGLYLLLIEKTKRSRSSWRLPAFSAMLCYGLMFLVVRQMTNLGISPAQVLLALFSFAAIGFLVIGRLEKVPLVLEETPRLVIIPLVLAIVVAFGTNLLNFIAIKLVSNPGYSTAVFNSAVVPTLLLSRIVFPKEGGGEFNLTKWLGAIVTISGVVLVILG